MLHAVLSCLGLTAFLRTALGGPAGLQYSRRDDATSRPATNDDTCGHHQLARLGQSQANVANEETHPPRDLDSTPATDKSLLL
jgi:hypothetical protein